MTTIIEMLKTTVFCGVVIVLFGTVVGSAQAGETISITLHSGRKFTAEVHVRTNAQRLWLRFGQEGTSLLRPVVWDQVAFATVGVQKLTAEELKAQASILARPKANSNPIEPQPVSAFNTAPTNAEQAVHALRDE